MVSKKKNKRKFGIALTGLAAAGMFAATIPALQVSASDETANLIEILRGLGWTGDQIADLQLGVEGRLTIEEAIARVKEQEQNKAQ